MHIGTSHWWLFSMKCFINFYFNTKFVIKRKMWTQTSTVCTFFTFYVRQILFHFVTLGQACFSLQWFQYTLRYIFILLFFFFKLTIHFLFVVGTFDSPDIGQFNAIIDSQKGPTTQLTTKTDFPLKSWQPKVQTPYYVAPGELPRKIEIERLAQ